MEHVIEIYYFCSKANFPNLAVGRSVEWTKVAFVIVYPGAINTDDAIAITRHCYINVPTRFIRVAYRRKHRNADLHNAMHYATINMRGVELERRRTYRARHRIVARRSKFRNFFPPLAQESVYASAFPISRSQPGTEIYEPMAVGINKVALSATVRA
jgi:hypothetical protein